MLFSCCFSALHPEGHNPMCLQDRRKFRNRGKQSLCFLPMLRFFPQILLPFEFLLISVGLTNVSCKGRIETRKAPVSSLFSKGRKLLKSSAVPPSLIDADASTLSCDTAPKCPSLFRTAASHQPTALCKCSADTPLLHRSND